MSELKQTITITIEFKEEMNPGTEEHLLSVLQNYLRPKGIELDDNKVIRI